MQKNEPGIEIYDHTLPLQEDITRVGSVELKSNPNRIIILVIRCIQTFLQIFGCMIVPLLNGYPKLIFPELTG
ncbi:MAG: hypothetical protein IPJ09_17615 [Saprospiraceae bacterium]|nr:hypothetical protein [Saprospiraceae bacterium]